MVYKYKYARLIASFASWFAHSRVVGSVWVWREGEICLGGLVWFNGRNL